MRHFSQHLSEQSRIDAFKAADAPVCTYAEYLTLVGDLGGWMQNGDVYFASNQQHEAFRKACAERGVTVGRVTDPDHTDYHENWEAADA